MSLKKFLNIDGLKQVVSIIKELINQAIASANYYTDNKLKQVTSHVVIEIRPAIKGVVAYLSDNSTPPRKIFCHFRRIRHNCI